MLRTYVSSLLQEYSQADTKLGKSEIISNVVKHVQKTGHFVKRDVAVGGGEGGTGRWVPAEYRLCREKCSQTFRDALHLSYRSSRVAKKNKRRALAAFQSTTSVNTIVSNSSHSASSLSGDDDTDDEQEMFTTMQPQNTSSSNKRRRVDAISSLYDWNVPCLFTSETAPKSSNNDTNLVSILAEHFAADTSASMMDENPFEPTPLPGLTYEQEQQRNTLAPASFFEEDPFLMGSMQQQQFSSTTMNPDGFPNLRAAFAA